MDEYILRSEILKHKRLMEGFNWDGNFRDAAVLVEDILKIKATDVAPVRYGCWERVIPSKSAAKWSTRVSCSNCHSVGYTRYKYCPNCGAKMDGGINNG